MSQSEGIWGLVYQKHGHGGSTTKKIWHIVLIGYVITFSYSTLHQTANAKQPAWHSTDTSYIGIKYNTINCCCRHQARISEEGVASRDNIYIEKWQLVYFTIIEMHVRRAVDNDVWWQRCEMALCWWWRWQLQDNGHLMLWTLTLYRNLQLDPLSFGL